MRPPTPAVRPLCATLSCLGIIVVMASCAGDPADDDQPTRDPGAAAVPGDARGAGGPLDDTTLAAAVAATRAVQRARVELRVAVAGPSGPVVLVHRAAFTDGGLRARAASDLTEAAAALEAAGRGLDGDWSHPTGVVVDGDVVYSQLGPMAEALGRSPDDWVRARLEDVTAAGAENDALALALDPLGPLDLLYRPVREVGEVAAPAGEEAAHLAVETAAPADGPPPGATRRLHATLDLTGAQAAPPASFEARLLAAGVDALPVDVWLDGAGRVRRLQVALDVAGSLTTTFDVADLDGAVEVSPPDPADVVTVAPPGAG